ncbi:MAG: hypothetical protein HYY96_08325 [Candidatus Tectomicrobia bacterium]|nr:hypothetical protein [Candidatus Tectomicrobia bacterium]
MSQGTQAPLTSRSYEAHDEVAAMELYHERGWTDGLPIVPPTEPRIRAMLAAADLAPERVLGTVHERQRVITAEKLAINAVMAGCLPEYMPVLAAAMEAMCDPRFGLHGPVASTAGVAVLVIVHGPIARAIGVNSKANLFGQGWRANAGIGRAVRLVLMNVCGAIPGQLDRATLGHPGKYTYCIAEDEADSPWTPMHVERGFAAAESAVTVFAADAPHSVSNHTSRSPEGILDTIADSMVTLGAANIMGRTEALIVISGEHRQTIAGAGWDKSRIRGYLFEKARRPLAEVKRAGRLPGPITPEDERTMKTAVPAPEEIMVIAAGGDAGRFSAFVPGWAGGLSTHSVTKRVAQREG